MIYSGIIFVPALILKCHHGILSDAFVEIDHIVHRDLFYNEERGVYYVCDGETITPFIWNVIATEHYSDFVMMLAQRLKNLEMTDEESCAFIMISVFSAGNSS